ncbi:integral membrane sensor domain MASE1 [Saccharothrix ecbatanensis]|uniref:Integral membrane sensor domain MASE1 n=1 Tax=Saccharothrix ecbatanensis TaxID=1105145 RepID=A0A7W9HLM8_9PSEU|nr:MASE1 domain-containing protein [Saccharothrix ecbatanensis]MBB5804376.1 integral membrane sensor domain MASE1 [Saccharothrix ecbatanensis]
MQLSPRLGRYALHLLLVAAGYYLGARLGLLQALVNDQVTPLWPPTGVAVLALVLGGLRMWPGVAVGAFAVNATLTDIGSTVLISAGNTLGPVVAYLLLSRAGFRQEMDRTRDALTLVFLGAFVAMAVSATIGSGTLLLTGVIDGAGFWSTWAVWWTGDALGVLVLVPIALAFRTLRLRNHPARRWMEAAALLVSTTVVMAVATTHDLRLMYLVFPFLIWAALRFQHLGTAPCALIATTLAARGAAMSSGPFAGLDLFVRMVTLQAFNATTVLTALLLSAVIAERNAARQAIERTVAQLADVVQQYQPLLLGNVQPPQRPEKR